MCRRSTSATMKYKLFVFVCSFLISGSSTTSIGVCEIEDNDELNIGFTSIYEVIINDIDSFEKSIPYTGDLTLILSNTDEDSAYIYTEVVLEDGKLVLRTNSNFSDKFEEDFKAQDPQPTFTIRRVVGLRCGDWEGGFIFTLVITDTNNHKPTFPTISYTYKLPSPVSPSFDLTSVGESIIVTDLDFSNTDITFTVTDSSVFTIETVKVESSESQREYRGIFKVNQFQTLTGNTELTVTATDNGNPAQTSEPITVTIEVDTEHSLPSVPSFSQLLYTFEYSTEMGLTGDEIEVTGANFDAVTVTLTDQSGDTSLYFEGVYDDATNTITIQSTGTKPEISSTPVLVLTLTVILDERDDQSSKAVVLIQLPTELVVTAPTFSKSYYMARYEVDGETPTVVLSEEILVTENANIALEGDETHFGIENVGGKWQVEVTTALEDAVLETGGDIILTLHATIIADDDATYDGYATLVVKLPMVVVTTTAPKFSRPYYTATYIVDEYDHHVEMMVIESSESADVSLEGGYGEYFDIFCANTECILLVVKELTSEILESSTDLLLVLNATKDDVSATATVVIALPLQETAKAPRFNQSVYTATYKDGELTDVSSITIQGYPTRVYVAIDENSLIGEQKATEYLTIAPNGDHWIVTVINNLPSDVVTKEAVILVNLIAIKEGVTTIGEAGLIIKLPKTQDSSTFASVDTTYMANYVLDEGNEDPKLSLESEIQITGELEGVDITLSGDYRDYFVQSFDPSTRKVDIALADDKIETNTLESDVAVTINIEASKNTEVHKAVVGVKLPKKVSATVLNFEKLAYVVEYRVEDGAVAILLEKDIILLGDNDASASISLSDYTDYFDVTRDEENPDKILVLCKKNLDSVILDNEVVLFADIVADGVDQTKAKLLIKLPQKIVPSNFYFDQTFYMADYTVNDDGSASFTLSDSIKINGEAEGVNVDIEDENEYFTVTYNEDHSVTIFLIKPLDDSYLENAVMSINIVAFKGNQSTEAILVIRLPKFQEEQEISAIRSLHDKRLDEIFKRLFAKDITQK